MTDFVLLFFLVCFVFQSQVQANLNQSNTSGDALESVLTDFDGVFSSSRFVLENLGCTILFFLPPIPLQPLLQKLGGVGGGAVFESLCFIWALSRWYLSDC